MNGWVLMAGFVLFPFIIFFSVRLGRYAYLRANYLFELHHKGESHGTCERQEEEEAGSSVGEKIR